ncbi:hypothetical protein HDR63_01260 [bacterium]|nr:hypothetical protein [bacterium]
MDYPDLTPAQQARVEEMRRMTPREWDALCKGCGICCLTKVDMGGGVTVYLNRCCAHLDTATRRCRIYNTRLTQRRERCKKVDLDVVLAGQLVPASCGYREYIFGPAQFPARVDFTSVRPMRDGDFEKMSTADVLRHIIAGSNRWNER